MEPVGFTLAIASLAGIFTSCVECFEMIQVGRRIGQDKSTCLCRLDCAEVAFLRWGSSLGIGTVKSTSDPLPLTPAQISATTQKEFDTAKSLLGDIEWHFDDAKEMSQRYISRFPLEDVEHVDPATDLDGHFKTLHIAKRKTAEKLQKRLSFSKKAKWAVFDKKKFEILIDEVSELVDKLVQLFPSAKENQLQQCKNEIAEIEDKDDLIRFGKFAENDDKLLAAAVKEHLSARGHLVEDFEVSGNGSVLWVGDRNAHGGASRGHQVRNFKILAGGTSRIGNDNYSFRDSEKKD